MKTMIRLLVVAIAAMLPLSAGAQTAVKPLKALLVLGGCCHDYAVQKDLLKAGIEQRVNITVDIAYSADKNTKPTFECYKKDNWAEGYDVVIHDECAADSNDLDLVKRVLAPHRDGLPGVNLHCAMHSFRVSPEFKKPQPLGSDGGMWFEYIGLQSSGHGPKKPIEVTYIKDASPITKGFQNWTTIDEELYNNVHIYEGTKPIATGKQLGQETVVAWVSEYGPKKTKVFSTTLGHFNETVSDARYLDLVSRGLLWACGKLGEDGTPAAGYWVEKP